MKGTIVDSRYSLMTPEKAEATAVELNAVDSEGWSYVVKHDPTGRGKSFIQVFDEEGFFVQNY